MPRKHFEAIAEILRKEAEWYAVTAPDPVASITEDIADYLATLNPRFDRARFLRAAGYGEDTP